jgi:hypothetical protein
MRAKICQSCIGRSKAGHDQVEAEMENARGRILEGIDILTRSDIARNAFHFMNLAIAMAARRRNAGATGDPAAQRAPEWRPFQLRSRKGRQPCRADNHHRARPTFGFRERPGSYLVNVG